MEMDSDTLKLAKNAISEKTKNSVRNLLDVLLPNLSMALAANLEPDRAAMYVDALEDLSECQVKHAFKKALKFWQPAYGLTFPSPAELRAYAEEIDGNPAPIMESLGEIDPEKLPKGWTEQEWKRAKVTLKVIRENTARPFPRQPGDECDDPHESRENFAKRLIAEMRAKIQSGAFDMPDAVETYQEYSEKCALGRLGVSTVPKDPKERTKWATAKAKEQGWLS